MPTDFWKRGVDVEPNFLSPEVCEKYCQSVLALDRAEGLPLIERQVRERSLKYKVVELKRPNAKDHRPRAIGSQPETATLSRGSVHPLVGPL